MADAQSLSVAERLRALLADLLGLNATRAAALDADSGLFGTMPELDSMAVAGLLTEIEDQFGIIIDDEDVDSDMLGTFGALTAYIERKLHPA